MAEKLSHESVATPLTPVEQTIGHLNRITKSPNAVTVLDELHAGYQVDGRRDVMAGEYMALSLTRYYESAQAAVTNFVTERYRANVGKLLGQIDVRVGNVPAGPQLIAVIHIGETGVHTYAEVRTDAENPRSIEARQCEDAAKPFGLDDFCERAAAALDDKGQTSTCFNETFTDDRLRILNQTLGMAES